VALLVQLMHALHSNIAIHFVMPEKSEGSQFQRLQKASKINWLP